MKIDSTVLKHLVLINQIGINMAIPIFICLFFGRWLDKRFSANGFITLIMLILGIIVALRNLYVITTRIINHQKGSKDE